MSQIGHSVAVELVIRMDWTKISNEELFMACMQVSFKCKRCGKCCQKMDGIAYNSVDCARMAKQLNLGVNEFRKEYTTQSTKQASDRWLNLVGEEQKCPFLGEKGCTQYEGRGQVCRAYPWFTTAAILQVRAGKPFKLFQQCPGMVESFKDVLTLAQSKLPYTTEQILKMDFAKHAWLWMLVGEGKEKMAEKICREMGYFNLVPLHDLEVTCRWWAAAWLTLMGPRRLQGMLDEVNSFE